MKKMKRLLSLIAVGAMAFSMMGTTVHAAETYENGNIWYGDDLSVAVEEGKDGYTFLSVCDEFAYYEASNHTVTVNNGGNGLAMPYLFVMLDTTEEYPNNTWSPNGLYSYGESNYEVLYCCDVETGYEDGVYYKRLNLEDSDYYEVEEAAHIRSIVTNSYPYVSVDEMKTNLKTAGFEEADDLTRAEIITAVQAAIWSYANEEMGEYNYLKTYHVPDNDQWGKVLHDFTAEMNVWWKTGKRVFTEKTEQDAIVVGKRIDALKDYLKNLPPVYVENDEIIISDIQIVSSAPIRSEDATKKDIYNVALQVELNNSGSGEHDNIKLEVYVDDELITSTAIEFGTEEYTFNVDAQMGQTIKAVVSGKQDIPKGVYFYEPEGGRDASQCLVGVAEGETDVYAEASVTMQERILQFHKKTEIDDEQHSLKGIEFEIYYVCSVEEYNNILKDGDSTNDAAFETPSKEAFPNKIYIDTVKTDEGGRASYNLTKNGKQDGIYLIVEKTHDAIEKTLNPFLITVPMTDKDGHPVYHMNLSLKNDVVRPEVDKDVTEIGQKEDTQNVGDTVTWIIRGDIPKDMAKASLYQLTDELDYRLTYDGNVVVKVEEISSKADNSKEGQNVLEEETDYILTTTAGTIDPNPDDEVTETEAITTIVVRLTKAGREKVAQIVGEDYTDYELRVYFNSHIDEDATMGTEIPNTVKLEYTNSVDYYWNVEPEEEPVVYTCGISIEKYDAKDNTIKLSGAEFELVRAATEAEKNAVDSTAFPLVILNEENKPETIYAVPVEFYDNAALSGDKVTRITTGEGGSALIYGLKEEVVETIVKEDSTTEEKVLPYYLVETKAPVLVDENTNEVIAKYNLLSYPVKITLSKVSHEAENKIGVANSSEFRLPSTGGIGTGIFTVSGGMLIALAGAVLVHNKKKEREE